MKRWGNLQEPLKEHEVICNDTSTGPHFHHSSLKSKGKQNRKSEGTSGLCGKEFNLILKYIRHQSFEFHLFKNWGWKWKCWFKDVWDLLFVGGKGWDAASREVSHSWLLSPHLCAKNWGKDREGRGARRTASGGGPPPGTGRPHTPCLSPLSLESVTSWEETSSRWKDYHYFSFEIFEENWCEYLGASKHI